MKTGQQMNGVTGALVGLGVLLLSGCGENEQADNVTGRADGEDQIVDEATERGLTVSDLKIASTNIFQQMDQVPDDQGNLKPLGLTEEEIKGRNTWILWTGGDQRFWDRMARTSVGLIDLLKLVDTKAGPNRSERFEQFGLINEPGFKQATEPGPYGLYLDVPEGGGGSRNLGEKPYGRVDRHLYKKQGLPWYDYGYSTGIMGVRIFPNPNFDEEAQEQWDAEKWRNDPDYYTNEDLVRPYRVGISCGVCHVSYNPLNPPEDPAEPKWANLASMIGNQYLHFPKATAHGLSKRGPQNFLWQMAVANQPAGTADTSRVATDHINNPQTINPIFNFSERERIAQQEKLAGDSLNLPRTKSERRVPHILQDGSDSVGALGATIRVYVNIGMFSKYWLTRHQVGLGFKAQEPFKIRHAQENSVWWQATEKRAPYVKAFLRQIQPMHLRDVPGGEEYITDDAEVLRRGKIVFAENCARCHSSRQPEGIDVATTNGKTSEEAQAWFRDKILDPDSVFWEDNFFSDDRRYPVTQIGTGAGRALASNAARGHIWGSFSSETYKALPPVGTIRVYNPLQPDTPDTFESSSQALGYYRTPTLIGLWSSAPFFHNNALGEPTGDPSLAGRMTAFNDAVEKLLWPEKRPSQFQRVKTEEAVEVLRADPGPGRSGNRPGKLTYRKVEDSYWWKPTTEEGIWKTTQKSYLELPKQAFPELVRKPLADHFEDGMLRLGPVPKGTPINLLGSFDLSLKEPGEGPIDVARRATNLAKTVIRIKRALGDVEGLPPEAARQQLKEELVPELREGSQYPGLVVDRGHYFGAHLSDADKRALIEFLKTL